jgi:hypothetical protein
MSETPTFDTGPLLAAVDLVKIGANIRPLTAVQLVEAEAQKLAEQAYWRGEAKGISAFLYHDCAVIWEHDEDDGHWCPACKRLAEARRRAGGAE